MARRGSNNFNRNDLRRAIRGARESGINPTMIEIEGKDGTRFRVFGDRAPEVLSAKEQAKAAAEWDTATAQVRERAPKPARTKRT
jgi:hypothetical protein